MDSNHGNLWDSVENKQPEGWRNCLIIVTLNYFVDVALNFVIIILYLIVKKYIYCLDMKEYNLSSAIIGST